MTVLTYESIQSHLEMSENLKAIGGNLGKWPEVWELPKKNLSEKSGYCLLHVCCNVSVC